MSLRVWLPLNGDLRNNGIDDVTITNHGATVDNNGKIGKCYYFNGSSYIDTGCTESIGTGDFTISAWVYITQAGKTYQCIVGNKSTGAASVGFALYWNPNQKKFLWSTADGTGATEIWSMNTFDDIIYDSWHHIVMVRNSNDSKIGYFYLDGIRKEIASTPSIRNITSANTIKIGSVYPTSTSYYFTGKINDLRIYDHALSETEIKKISQGLILHYALNRSGFGQENLLSGNNAKILTWTNYMPNSVTLSGDGYDNKYTLIKGIGGWEKIFTEPITVTSGDTYTLSFIYSVEQDYTGYSGQFGLSVCSTSQNKYGNDTDVITKFNFGLTKKDKTKASITFTPNSDTIYLVANGGCISDGQENISFYISYLKLEKGDTATPWCPNSTSAEYNILNLNNNIEYDMSGYNHNGTYIGNIAFESDSPKYNASVHLLSTDLRSYTSDNACYLISSNTLNIDKNAMTIAFWGKLQLGYGDGWQGVFCTSLYEGNDYTTSALNHYDTRVRVNASDGSYLRPIPPFVANEWHHYVFVYDGINFIIYKDGAVSSTSSFSSKKTLGDFNKIIIGLSVAGGAWRKNNCNFSDFRIYATALSQADIAELYSIHRS